MGCCGKVCPSILLILGIVLFLSSFGLDSFIKSKIDQELGKRLVLLNDTDFYKNWKSPPIPIYSKFYLFNITNSLAFSRGAVPILRQVGPFVFRKKLSRQILGYNDDHEELTFITKNHFTFAPKLSDQDNYDSTICTLNIPLAALIGKMVQRSKTDSAVKFALNTILAQKLRSLQEKIVVCTTPRKYLVDKYPIKVLQEMAKLSPTPVEAPDAFSIMMARNGSDRGVWTVFTGKSNPSMTGVIKTWNNQTEVKCWHGEPCDQIRGSEGAFFAPPITPEKKISIFSPELNITMIGTYSHAHQEHSLLKYRFSLFENQFKNQDNSCYCSRVDEEERLRYCPLDGLIDLYNCTGGLPFFMSKPHFYNSEDRLLKWSIGLSPDRKLHESYMDLDPYLGVVSGATVRMQLNVDMEPIRQVALFKNMRPYIVPSNWVEESIQIEGDFLQPIQQMQGVIYKVNLTVKAIMLFGIALVCASIILWFKARKMKEKLQTYDPKNLKSSVDEDVKSSFITPSSESSPVAVKYSATGKFDEKQVPLLNKKVDENVKRLPSSIAEVDDEDAEYSTVDETGKNHSTENSSNNNN